MAKVTNWKVYDLEESILASGYPMLAEMSKESFRELEIGMILTCLEDGDYSPNRHIKRAITLANTKGGGHDNFLKGILVAFDLTFSNKAWVEMERYQFCQIVSSQSTMHKIGQMEISDCCNEHICSNVLTDVERLQQIYFDSKNTEFEKEAYLDLLYNIPSGFELTARMTTNYLCLKNIYAQRRTHRLPDWHVFCDWIEGLPMAEEFICGGGDESDGQ